MKPLLWNRRAARIALASIACWLLLGWFWGDDLPSTILRAFGATLNIFAIGALYAAQNPVARTFRVALGAVLGGWCAQILGGSTEEALAAAAAIGLVLVIGEYQIQRDLRRRAAS